MAYLQAAAGLVLLVFAGDIMVRGAVSAAQRLGVSSLVIGLTVVALGTSAPELIVAVDAVLVGAPSLALGNVVGSNIANVLLVIGLPALILPVACNAKRIGRNTVIMLLATLIFIYMAFDSVYTWHDGAVLLSLLVAFLLYSAIYGKDKKDESFLIEELEEELEKPLTPFAAWAMVIGGLLGLMLGADLLVEGAVTIARTWGVSEAIIGLTLVAVGTSIPELVTAVVAAIRGHADVAIGNVIGSNIFNLLGILGVASLVGDIPVPPTFLEVDMWVMLASSALLVPFCGLKSKITLPIGFMLLIGYIVYIVSLTSNVASATAMGM